jgi:hypothetical protein
MTVSGAVGVDSNVIRITHASGLWCAQIGPEGFEVIAYSPEPLWAVRYVLDQLERGWLFDEHWDGAIASDPYPLQRGVDRIKAGMGNVEVLHVFAGHVKALVVPFETEHQRLKDEVAELRRRNTALTLQLARRPPPGGTKYLEAKSEVGITVSLIDAVVAMGALLKLRDLRHPIAADALKDLATDTDLADLVAAGRG